MKAARPAAVQGVFTITRLSPCSDDFPPPHALRHLCLVDDASQCATLTPIRSMYLVVVRVSVRCMLCAALTLCGFLLASAIYKGTVNDPTTFPPPNRAHGSYHWAFERILSASLVPMTAAAFVTSGTNYPVLDGLLGISLVVHSHIGVSDPDFLYGICHHTRPHVLCF